MGKFDLNRTERAPERIAEADPVAGPQWRGEVDDKADPAAAMIEDQDPVIVAKGPREADNPVGGCADERPPGRSEPGPARTNAALVHGPQPLDRRSIERELIGEGEARLRAGRSEGPRRRRLLGSKKAR